MRRKHDTEDDQDIRKPGFPIICSLSVHCTSFLSVSVYLILHFRSIAFRLFFLSISSLSSSSQSFISAIYKSTCLKSVSEL